MIFYIYFFKYKHCISSDGRFVSVGAPFGFPDDLTLGYIIGRSSFDLYIERLFAFRHTK